MKTLRTFVPAKDYATARRFYKELGFEERFSSNEITIIACGPESFLLQNAYQKIWADNFMMQLMVVDLDAWWEKLEALDLAARYEGVKVKAPEDYPWGLREIHLIDPSGVLWHITQLPVG